MEPEPRRPRGLCARMKDLVRSSSRGETSAPIKSKNVPSNVPEIPPAAAGATVGHLPIRPKPLPTIVTPTTPSPAPPVAEASKIEPDTKDLLLEEERTTIWETAYKQLQAEEPELVSSYEIVLEEVSSRPPGSDQASPDDGAADPADNNKSSPPKKLNLNEVSQIQLERLENRQWTWALFGSKNTIRDTIDSIFKLLVDSSALISIGMSFAPPYVSLPWSAISALIPLIMNNSAEQGDAISGLHYVTRVLFSYRIAEEVFLIDTRLKPIFSEAVLPLYKQLLRYQAAAAIYFGRNTLSRMGRDTLAGKHWSGEISNVRITEDNSRTSVQFLSTKQNLNAHIDLKGILDEQAAMIQSLPRRMSLQQVETTQILQWTSQIPFYSDHSHVKRDIGSVREQWLLKEPKYRTWRDSQSGILYLEGTVGKGKSSLMSGVIDDMLLKADGKVVFFYCSDTSSPQIGQAETTSRAFTVNLIRSFMGQVALSDDRLSLSPALLKQFEASYDKIPGGCVMSTEECVEVMELVIQENQKTQWTFIIDALDECKDPALLIQALQKLPGMSPRIRICISSREGKLSSVRGVFPTTTAIKITNQNFADIKNYVEKEVQKRGPSFGFTTAQQTKMMGLLTSRAQGMFLWVVLQIEIMLPKGILPIPRLGPDIDTQLLKLENSQLSGQSQLDATYKQILDTATSDEEASLQYTVITSALQWSVCSFRTLTARELAYVSSMRADGSFTSGITEGFVLISCANLLAESKNVGVRLAHLSVGEFLNRAMPEIYSPATAHGAVAICCLLFRSSPAAHELTSDSEIFQARRAESPHTAISEQEPTTTIDDLWTRPEWTKLQSYVSWYWPSHCRHARPSQSLFDMIPECEAMELHSAIRSRNHAALRAMIARGVDINGEIEPASTRSTSEFQLSLETHRQEPCTALHEAVRLHDSDGVEILILAGADVDRKDIHGCSPLHTAAFFDDATIITSLIRAGADKNPRDPVGASPLHYAVYHNHENSTRVLLALGAQRDSLDSRMNTPLHASACLAFNSIVRVLIWSGCNTNARNIDGRTPSQIMFRSNSISLRQLSAATGANIGPHDDSRQTATELGGSTVRSDHNNSLEAPYSVGSLPFTVTSNRLCTYCDVSSWLNGSRDVIKHAHQSSLKDLQLSAESGCDVCLLFLNGLLSQEKPSLQASDETQVWVEVSRTWEMMLHGTTRHLLTVTVGMIASYEIEMCSKGYDAFDYISGRSIGPSSNSVDTFSKLAEWMAGCEKSHHICRFREAQVELPKRLVDISEDPTPGRVRLVKGSDLALARSTGPSTASHSHDYAFLSHRYGEQIVFDMTRRMWQDPERSIPVQDLLPSFQDAITLMRQFGIRYLWVDKLCIDWVAGDGEKDSVSETARLAEYCKHAALVINAGDHEDTDGIFSRRETNLLELTCELNDRRTAVLCFRKPLPSAEQCFSDQILSRAWIFQEIALPRRVIIFGKDQVYWKCRQQVCSEGNASASQPPLDFSAVSPDSDDALDKLALFDKWYKMVSLFSSKHISFFNDRLPAMKGMAVVQESNLRKRGLLTGYATPYRRGVWEPDLHRGLLWYASDVRNASRPPSDVPSWSWASLEGAISYSFLPGLPASGSDSMTGVTVRDASTIGSLTTVLRSTVSTPVRPNVFKPEIVNAPWKNIDLASQDGTCQILFDTKEDEDRWLDGAGYVVVMISKWSPERSGMYSRWIGLLLEIVKSVDFKTERSIIRRFRVGLVLGPWLDGEVGRWRRGNFELTDGRLNHAENVIEVDEVRDVDYAAVVAR